MSLRLLCDRRDELGASRTQAVCRLHRLLSELTPGGTHRGLAADKAEQLLAATPSRSTRSEQCAASWRHQHLDDIRALDAKMTAVRAQIAALVDGTGTRLTELYGIGPVIAGRILAEVDTIDRFPSKDHFASYNGTAPIDVSSGEQVRHRLSRAGNRRLNHALHMMAVTQIRQPNTVGRRYYERKRLEGKTPKEAMRCLKRRLSDVVYWQLVADRRATIAHVRISYDADADAVYIHLGRQTGAAHVAPPRRPPHPTGSTGSSRSTGKTAGSSASKSSTPARRLTPRHPRRSRHATEPAAKNHLRRCSRPPPNLGARSRGQGWRSHPTGYGLDPGEDDDTIPGGNRPPQLLTERCRYRASEDPR